MANLPKLPKTSEFHLNMLDDKDRVNYQYEQYINEMSLSNRSMISKFWNITKAQWNINKNILAGAEGLLDGNFKQLEQLSQTFGKTQADLTMKINELKAENVGKEFSKEFTPLFASLSQKYLLSNDVYKQLDWATKISDPVSKTSTVTDNAIPVKNNNTSLDPNQVSFINSLAEALSLKIDEKLALSGNGKGKKKPTDEEKKDDEHQKKADRFYSKMLTWMGYDKAKEAINATRDEAKKPSILGKVFSKTASMTKSVLDNIFDLPMFLSNLMASWTVKFVGMLGTGLGMALVVGKKLLLSRLGLVTIAASLLATDFVQTYMKKAIAAIFGDEAVGKLTKFVEGFDWTAALTGAALFAGVKTAKGGLMRGLGMAIFSGITGAILGIIGATLIENIMGVSSEDLKKKAADVFGERKIIEEALKASALKVEDIQKKLAEVANEKDSLYKTYLEKELERAILQRDKLKDQAVALPEIQRRALMDAALIDEWGWAGKFIAGVGKTTDDFMNWTSKLVGFDTMNEMGAFLDRKILEFVGGIGEKYDAFKQKMSDLAGLPGKLLDQITNYLDRKVTDVQKYIFDKTGGWFGADPVEGKGTIGKAVDNMSFSPGKGTVATPEGTTEKVNAMKANMEAIDKQRRERANALINAPISNSNSSVVNNNNSSTVQIRTSPIDPLFGSRAW